MVLDQLTRTAVTATLHCLTGCAIGEVLGLALATWWGWTTAPSVALAVALAFVFGYAFTLVPVLRSGMPVRRAIGVALAADTVSIATMEVVDNGIMLTVPGAMDAGLGDVLFWGTLAVALLIAFALTVPVNRWLIARGRGHAVVHGLHGGHEDHGHEDHGHEDHGHEDHGHEDHGHADGPTRSDHAAHA